MGLGGGPELLVPEMAAPAGGEVEDVLNLVGWVHLETVIGGGGAGFNGVGRAGIGRLENLSEKGAGKQIRQHLVCLLYVYNFLVMFWERLSPLEHLTLEILLGA